MHKCCTLTPRGSNPLPIPTHNKAKTMNCGRIPRIMTIMGTYSLPAAKSQYHPRYRTKIDSLRKSNLLGPGMASGHRSLCTRGVLVTGPFNVQRSRAYASKSEETADPLQSRRWQETRRTFLQGPEAYQLFQEVSNAGQFTIELVSSEQAPTGGAVRPKTREILLSKTISDWGPSLLFQLNNLKQAKEILHINENMSSLGPEGYTTRTQRVEWQSALKSHEIARKCIKRGVWPPSWDRYAEAFTGRPDAPMDWTTFEGFRKTQETTMQADLYREQWYRVCDPARLADFRARNLFKWITYRNSVTQR